MDPNFITGLFTGLGAVVGAGATMGANAITAHGQRRMADVERQDRMAESRRAACATYLTTVDGFRDRCRELASTLSDGGDPEHLGGVHRRYLAEWDDLLRSCAPVVVAGPAGWGLSATALREALATLSDECDNWYDAVRSGPTRARWARFHEASGEADTARNDFIQTVQNYKES